MLIQFILCGLTVWGMGGHYAPSKKILIVNFMTLELIRLVLPRMRQSTYLSLRILILMKINALQGKDHRIAEHEVYVHLPLVVCVCMCVCARVYVCVCACTICRCHSSNSVSCYDSRRSVKLSQGSPTDSSRHLRTILKLQNVCIHSKIRRQ